MKGKTMNKNISIKKLAIGLISVIMVLSMGISSYATLEVDQNQVLSSAIKIVSESLEEGNTKIRINQDELEQKQQEVELQLQKWNSLSETEKAQIYEMAGKSREILKEMVQRYLELNLVEQGETDPTLEEINTHENNEKSENHVGEIGGLKIPQLVMEEY